MLNGLPRAIEIAYKFSNQVAFCVHVSVWSLQVSGLLLKRRTDWWRPLGGQNECGRLSASVTTRLSLCDVMRTYAGMGIKGPLLNCMADSACLSRTRMHTLAPSSTGSKMLFKKPPSLWRNQAACVSSVLAAVWTFGPFGSGVIWWRHAPRASVRHRVTPHWAWL